MTTYRVTLDLFFDQLADVQAFKTALLTYISKTRNVGTGPNLETSKAILHVCHHDETPPGPCNEILYKWEHV